MKYIRLDIELNREAIEPITTALMEVGISDIVVEDPNDIKEMMQRKNSYDWDYVDDEVLKKLNETPKIVIYFEENEMNLLQVKKVKDVILNLKKDAMCGVYGKDVDFGKLDVSHCILDDSEWKDKWKEYFKPTKISNKIVVKPTWEKYDKVADEKIIEIDPGMAFGTGTHETTSLCIKMIEKYINEGDKLLDVGCGSGILSIAGALLGGKDILAIDIDSIAVEVAKENIELNHVSGLIDVREGNLTEGIDYKADIVVANLMADLVKMLSKDVEKHLNSKGIYISSGILEEKADEVKVAIVEAGFEIIEVVKDDIWIAIVAKK